MNVMAELSKESIELRRAELELARLETDRELRRWCVEQATKQFASHGCDVLEEANKIYDWVRGKPAQPPKIAA